MSAVREIRCSTLARFMNCEGFFYMQDLPENVAGPAAEEGTAAGELLQAMIEQRTTNPQVSSHAKNNVRFDQDMWYYLRPIAERVLRDSQGTALCETRIDWNPGLNGILIRGQYDIGYVLGDTLFIEDLKYGWGIVEVKENWQLIGYAIGEAFRLNRANPGWWPAYINFTIHQPRPHHEDGSTRSWRITFNELIGYYNRISEHFKNVSRTLRTGPHCRYCPAAGEDCTALSRATNNVVDVVLGDFRQDSLSDADLAEQIRLLERCADILEIKQSAITDLAASRISSGSVIPGYSLEKQFGDRKWKPNVTAEAMKILTGGKDLLVTEMMSPAQAEKQGIPRDIVNRLVDRPFKKIKLVKCDTTVEAAKVFGNEIKLIK